MDRRDKLDCFYAAGVHVCRSIRTGTVHLGIINETQTRSLTLVIARASWPAPACEPAGTFRVDALDGGPPWPALCLRVGSVLRVENHGPGGFVASPPNLVSCWYEAAVRECRLDRAGTVTFTLTYEEWETRTLNVVVVR